MFAAHLPCDYALKFLQENQPKSSETFIEKLLRNFYDEGLRLIHFKTFFKNLIEPKKGGGFKIKTKTSSKSS